MHMPTTPLNVRGSFLIASMHFVQERYGAAAHDRVVAALPPAARARVETGLREASWEPLEHAVAYMEAARDRLAPGDPSFFREMGRYAGRAGRASGFGVMVADPERAVRTFAVFARAIVDFGRVELVARTDCSFVARFHGFPPVQALCERRVGAYEELLHAPGTVVTVTETACVRAGDAWCELRVTWGRCAGS